MLWRVRESAGGSTCEVLSRSKWRRNLQQLLARRELLAAQESARTRDSMGKKLRGRVGGAEGAAYLRHRRHGLVSYRGVVMNSEDDDCPNTFTHWRSIWHYPDSGSVSSSLC